MHSLNPYEVLGLAPGATDDEIRAAYRRRAAQVHPDLQPSARKAWAMEEMTRLNQARDLLMDPVRRARLEALTARLRYAEAMRTRAYSQSGRGTGWDEQVRARRRVYKLRQTLTGLAALVVLMLFGLLALFAPATALTIGRLAAGLVAFWLALSGPIVVTLVLAFIILSIWKS